MTHGASSKSSGGTRRGPWGKSAGAWPWGCKWARQGMRGGQREPGLGLMADPRVLPQSWSGEVTMLLGKSWLLAQSCPVPQPQRKCWPIRGHPRLSRGQVSAEPAGWDPGEAGLSVRVSWRLLLGEGACCVDLGTVDRGKNHLEGALGRSTYHAQEQSGPRLLEGSVFGI